MRYIPHRICKLSILSQKVAGQNTCNRLKEFIIAHRSGKTVEFPVINTTVKFSSLYDAHAMCLQFL